MVRTVLKNNVCAHGCLVVLKAGLLTGKIRGLLCRKLLKRLNLKSMVWVTILCCVQTFVYFTEVV